ncbi:16S rRNA (guanine(966)-N(2))-methyltransferase RsmD [Ideonella sp.]|uniref:16S rRNA (guanine(966)-N(2))-methyltransferase RsmD n=1 Tax=Ideonella sp. TaxID=1929293 RepID=UPI003BB4DD36
MSDSVTRSQATKVKTEGKATVQTKAAPRGARHEVRIIGGLWRRSLLPVADRPGLRPTPDRVRETLFNWLGQDLSGWRVLDAFAGSGALGFEAASRGAAEVLLLERDPVLVDSLNASRQRLGAQALKVQRSEAMAWLRQPPAPRFELILLDPPFDAELALPALVAALPLVVPGGYVYVESAAALPAQLPAGVVVLRQSRAGAVHFALLQRSDAAAVPEPAPAAA